MKMDSIPIAVIAAFLAASQLAFSLPTSESGRAPVRVGMPAEPSDRDGSSDPPNAEQR